MNEPSLCGDEIDAHACSIVYIIYSYHAYSYTYTNIPTHLVVLEDLIGALICGLVSLASRRMMGEYACEQLPFFVLHMYIQMVLRQHLYMHLPQVICDI